MYNGVPQQVFDYLNALKNNNTREWFEEHRADYEAHWKHAALDLVDALAGPLGDLKPGLRAEARLNGSLRRINRDVRFSKDKTPYNPRIHLIFWTKGHPNRSPGFHLVIHGDGIGYGAGQFGFDPKGLSALRDRYTRPKDRATLLKAIKRARSVGCEFGEPDLKRLPKGYEADGDWEHLLRRKSLVLRTLENRPVPDWIFTRDAVEEIVNLAKATSPLLDWLSHY